MGFNPKVSLKTLGRQNRVRLGVSNIFLVAKALYGAKHVRKEIIFNKEVLIKQLSYWCQQKSYRKGLPY